MKIWKFSGQATYSLSSCTFETIPIVRRQSWRPMDTCTVLSEHKLGFRGTRRVLRSPIGTDNRVSILFNRTYGTENYSREQPKRVEIQDTRFSTGNNHITMLANFSNVSVSELKSIPRGCKWNKLPTSTFDDNRMFQWTSVNLTRQANISVHFPFSTFSCSHFPHHYILRSADYLFFDFRNANHTFAEFPAFSRCRTRKRVITRPIKWRRGMISSFRQLRAKRARGEGCSIQPTQLHSTSQYNTVI